jgi:two-component system OmpR family sensor kinase
MASAIWRPAFPRQSEKREGPHRNRDRMTVRWRILLFELIILAFVGLMVAVILFGLRLTDEFVTRIDGVHRRFEVIAELEAHANNYAEQIAEVLLLGPEQRPDFDAARAEMDEAFERLTEVTRAEVSTLDGLAEIQRELSDVEDASRMTELYNAIDRAAQRVFALQDAGRQDEAVDIFRRDVEYRLSNDFEELIEAALQDERNEVAAERAEVRAQQELAFLGAGALSLIALAASAFLGLSLHRSIARPMRELATGADAIAAGRFDYRIPEQGRDELAAVSRSFNAMAQAVEEQRAGLVSAQARLETEVASRTRELQAANERLRDLDGRRAQFLADVSHELRTPLTILRGEADFALRGRAEPEQCREALARIQGQAIEMGRLLDDLIAFARSDADDQGFEPEMVAAADIVTAAVQEGEVLAEPREIHVEAAFGDHGALISADPRRLRQAVLIGIDNAVKYSPPGSRVLIETAREGQSVTVAISDEGEGIAEDDKPHVFDRFYRGGAGGRRGGDGLGIGLAIAKSIVERHGGRVSLDNRPDRGAVLRIALPLAAEARR